MRKLRNAAIAGVTATALVFGGSTVATAQENPNGTSSSFISGWTQPDDAKFGEVIQSLFKPNGLHEAGKLTGADQEAKHTDLWGVRVDDTKNPQWARIWRDLINWLLLVTGIGAVIGALNFAYHEGYLPHPLPKP